MDGSMEAGRAGPPLQDHAWSLAVDALVAAGRRLDRHGWVPATAGNLSCRLADGRIAITRSGGHKGFLSPDSIIEVGLDGRAVDAAQRPSAETLLHCQIYREVMPHGTVLHGHSVPATVLSMASGDDTISFAGYELLKAFAGQTTHDVSLALPVLDNDQDIARLAGAVSRHLPGCTLGYLIRGHGIYVWGPDTDTALARLEGLEFLLACALERRKLGAMR